MTSNFSDAMRAATQLTRARKLGEATRLIQSALLLGRDPIQSDPRGETVIDAPALENFRAPPPAARHTLPEPALRLPAFVRGGLAKPRSPNTLDIPQGAQYLTRSFTNEAGSRTYKLYVPHRHHSGRRGLVVMLHGGTQDADDFAAGTRMNQLAEDHGLLIAYPAQCMAANSSLCWNWFLPEHQSRDQGEPSIIAGITRAIIAEYKIDPGRVFVAGLSAGGAMAAVLGETYPELYAAIGIHSGLPYRSASDVASAFAAMRGDLGVRGRHQRTQRHAPGNKHRTRTITFHGDADRIVHASNAAKIIGSQTRPGDTTERANAQSAARHAHTCIVTRDTEGEVVLEEWLVHGSGHAWSGGSVDGSYTDPHGPDASREMLRFFIESPRAELK